ncbi:MAG: glycosyltransferase family 8 protein [Anaerovoracaceae bacterium]
MNLLYCGDKNIEDGLIISILSVMKNTPCPVKIYVLTMRLETENKRYAPVSDSVIRWLDDYVRSVNKENGVQKIDVTKEFAEEIPEANLSTRFTPYCMLRLFADRVPEIPDKILYLDNDTICRGDLRPLYDRDISGYEYAGVLDHYGSWFFRKRILRRDYINSGVLLLNMKMIRASGLFEKCRRACAQNRMFMPDQTALNRLCRKKLILPRCYNEQRKLHKNTVIQHFTTSFRFFPWLHTLCVKPWQVEKMHSVLKLHAYDELLDEYQEVCMMLNRNN